MCTAGTCRGVTGTEACVGSAAGSCRDALQLNPPKRGLMLARGWRNTDQEKDVLVFFVLQNKGNWLKQLKVCLVRTVHF